MVLYPDGSSRPHYRDGGFRGDPFSGNPEFPWDGHLPNNGNNDGTDFGTGGATVPPGGGAPGAPPGAGAGGGGGGNGGNGGGGYGGRFPSVTPIYNFADAPEFTPPVFRQPTMQDALREPGYQFRLQGGANALEASAAAKGSLRTGGTLKDITEYGQNFATQEYGNVFNRALQSYDRDYRGAYDAFQPKMTEWSTLTQAEKERALAQFGREWQQFTYRPPGGGGGGGGSNQANDEAAAPPMPGWPAPGGSIKKTHPYWDWMRNYGGGAA